jgi:glycosyltransferase involved in cell wall biosynthesis
VGRPMIGSNSEPVRTKPAAAGRPERVAGLVSVVVPAYNAEKSLRRCLESILAQTYRGHQVIVINDGSTDGTEEIALSFGDRIAYLRQENSGETATRNRGFELASGEFVTFLDHDDFWYPGFLQACVDFLSDHPVAIGVGTGYEVRSALSDAVQVCPAFLTGAGDPGGKPFEIESFFSFWAENDHLHPGSAVVRGSIVDQAGGQRPELVLSGDLEYWAYLATFGRWGFIPQVLLHVDGTQIPGRRLFRKYYDRYQKAPSVEEWERRIVPRLQKADLQGYERVRGHIATWMVFAKVFVGDDREGLRMANKYRRHLDGKFGALWRLGSLLGIVSWKPMSMALRVRTRIQYFIRERKL